MIFFDMSSVKRQFLLAFLSHHMFRVFSSCLELNLLIREFSRIRKFLSCLQLTRKKIFVWISDNISCVIRIYQHTQKDALLDSIPIATGDFLTPWLQQQQSPRQIGCRRLAELAKFHVFR